LSISFTNTINNYDDDNNNNNNNNNVVTDSMHKINKYGLKFKVFSVPYRLMIFYDLSFLLACQ